MVSFQAIIYIALSANVALSFPTRPSDNDNSDQLVRRKWPIQPTDILICKNNIGDKKNPNWVDIDIHVSAAECAVHSAPVMNGGTPSDYPHEFTVREFIRLIVRSSNSCGRTEKIQPTRKGKSIGSHPLNFQIRDATRLAKSSASSLSSPYRIKRTRNGIIHLTVSPELWHTRFYI